MATPTPSPDQGLLGLIDQSPTLSAIVGGLVVVAIVALLSRVPKLKPIYKSVGRAVARFLKWVWSWRINGRVKRDSLVQQGYDKRDAEVKAERARSPRPSWRISTDTPFGEDVYFLNNSGWRVSDVRLDADPKFFTFDGRHSSPERSGITTRVARLGGSSGASRRTRAAVRV